jgi:hypothetical protein
MTPDQCWFAADCMVHRAAELERLAGDGPHVIGSKQEAWALDAKLARDLSEKVRVQWTK